MIFVPVAVFWALAAWAAVSRGPALLYLLFAVLPFGALAAVPPQATGGLSILPAPILGLLLAARFLAEPSGLRFTLSAGLSRNRLMLLAAFWVVAVVATLFLPRILAGHVQVIPVREVLYGAQPLQPTSQNISQLGYLTLSVVMVFAFARLGRDAALRQHLLAALMLGAAITVLTGLLDLASHFVPIGPVLDLFRTATYSILADVEVLNQRRVVGLMPEASSYGGLTVGFLTALYFLMPAIENRRLRLLALPLLLALGVMAYLSTSSAAYVGLAIFACLAALRWLLGRLGQGGRAPRHVLGLELMLAFGAAFGVVAIILLAPGAVDPIVALVERMVLEKASSASFEERSYWTATSWQALLDSGGLGVGVGSTRASSAPVAVFAATGFLGGLLFYAFVVQSLTRRPLPEPGAGAFMSGLRWSYPAPFVIGALAGTSANFGAFDAMRFGLAFALSAAALPRRPRVHSHVLAHRRIARPA
ncbi:MAG: hypothetical protein AAF416_04415 [Pseudomonadota bacterium]